jgi:hypothetical protein
MSLSKKIVIIGCILISIGIICLPLWNLRELPYVVDPGYPKGSGWISVIQTGIFTKPGITLIILGGSLCLIAQLLPKKYRKTDDEIFIERIQKDIEKKKRKPKHIT